MGQRWWWDNGVAEGRLPTGIKRDSAEAGLV